MYKKKLWKRKNRRKFEDMRRRRAKSIFHDKYYPNPFQDFSPKRSKHIVQYGKLQPEFIEKLQIVSQVLLGIVNDSLEQIGENDFSVYSGMSGIALLHLLLARRYHCPHFVQVGLDLIKKYFDNGDTLSVSFLTGLSGTLALGAVMYRKLGKVQESEKLIARIIRLLPHVVNANSFISDDVYCGRAGYLYTLLFINKHIGALPIGSCTIKKVVAAILNSGRAQAENEGLKIPLIYVLFNEYYVGAAHGMAGILLTLLQARSYMTPEELLLVVKPTIDCLVEMRLSGGNYPPLIGANDASYVQWCHGAPGMIELFALAYEVFRDEHYLRSALCCGEIVWNYGILRKGYGLCHGVSGNAYTFLKLYNTTKDPCYLYRACKFAEWCFSYGEYQDESDIAPLSLFEGIAGTTYFLFDLLEPEKALFPAFAL